MAYKKTTLDDVSAACGVSKTTVSLVINGKGDDARISQDTQDLIFRTARELDYIKPHSAKKRGSALFNWGGIFQFDVYWPIRDGSWISAEQFFQKLLNYQNSRTPLLSSTFTIKPYKAGRLHRMAPHFDKHLCDGALIIGSFEKDMEFLNNTTFEIPIALYGQQSEKHFCVTLDNYAMGSMVAKHFLSKGHKTFAVLKDALLPIQQIQRRSGFVDTLVSAGIPTENIQVLEPESNAASVSEAVRTLGAAANRPTALYYTHDYYAFNVMLTLFDIGLMVPEDIEIITSGNHDFNKALALQLTSVAPPLEQICSCLVDYLTDVAEHPENIKQNYNVQFQPQIIFRESCPACSF